MKKFNQNVFLKYLACPRESKKVREIEGCRRNRQFTGARSTPEDRLLAASEAVPVVVITQTHGTWRITLICVVIALPTCRVERDVLRRSARFAFLTREHARNTGNARLCDKFQQKYATFYSSWNLSRCEHIRLSCQKRNYMNFLFPTHNR